jgi:hypothetical protein
MGPVVYMLEIYEPGSGEAVLQSFSATSPFASFHTGDTINVQMAREGGAPGDPPLRVTRVEHLLWEAGGQVKHKLMVFTDAAHGFAEQIGARGRARE